MNGSAKASRTRMWFVVCLGCIAASCGDAPEMTAARAALSEANLELEAERAASGLLDGEMMAEAARIANLEGQLALPAPDDPILLTASFGCEWSEDAATFRKIFAWFHSSAISGARRAFPCAKFRIVIHASTDPTVRCAPGRLQRLADLTRSGCIKAGVREENVDVVVSPRELPYAPKGAAYNRSLDNRVELYIVLPPP